MKICLDNRFAEFSKGNLLKWIAENGSIASSYLDMCMPDEIVPYMERKKMEDVNYEMMLKASCRLAALLNEAFK